MDVQFYIGVDRAIGDDVTTVCEVRLEGGVLFIEDMVQEPREAEALLKYLGMAGTL